jgi:hypothetical protein
MGEHGAHVRFVHGEDHHEAGLAFLLDDAGRRRLRVELPFGGELSQPAPFVIRMLGG